MNGQKVIQKISKDLRERIRDLRDRIKGLGNTQDYEKARVLLDRALWSYPSSDTDQFLKQVIPLLSDESLKRELTRVRKQASSYYDMRGHSLEEVSCAWASEDRKLRDKQVHGHFETSELWGIREYTWTRDKSRPGYAYNPETGQKEQLEGPEKWDALKEDMKKNGWRQEEKPVLVDLGKGGKGKVSEGNHRLAIAKEIGLRRVPVQFFFRQKVPRGTQICQEASAPSLDELTEMLT